MDGPGRRLGPACVPAGARSVPAAPHGRGRPLRGWCRHPDHGHPAASQATSAAGRYSVVTGRIAVIDDEAPNRAYLQTLLGTAGFEVQAADGGNEGVALVKKERPDLQLSRTEVAAVLKMEVAAMILYQRDEFSAASKKRMPIVIHHAQAQATAQFTELMQALAAI